MFTCGYFFATSILLLIFWRFVIPLYVSPLSSLRGPPAVSWSYGNFKQILTVRNTDLIQRWATDYGPSCLIRSLGMVSPSQCVSKLADGLLPDALFVDRRPKNCRSHPVIRLQLREALREVQTCCTYH